jgi:hypothetical protein
MKEHTIRASDAIQPAVSMDCRFANQQRRKIALRSAPRSCGRRTERQGQQTVSASLALMERCPFASGIEEELGSLRRKASVTPAGDCAATEWILPRIVIQTSETVRLEGVSYTGDGVPRKGTVSRTGQSRPHKQNTQEGGSLAHACTRSGAFAEASAPALSPVERISLEGA